MANGPAAAGASAHSRGPEGVGNCCFVSDVGMKRSLIAWVLLAVSVSAADFKAGVGRVVITPSLPVWLSGYAARTNAANEVLQDLWAKALALEDGRGHRVVIVTTDLIGLPHEISAAVAKQVEQKYRLSRGQLLLSSSHTHSGPAVWPNLQVMFNLNAEDSQRAIAYSQTLTSNLVSVVVAALSDLAPALISVGHGEAQFAINRRQASDKGVRIGLNPTGPMDHDVPVLRISAPDGRLRAILFGYACHNTTLGADLYKVNGDYAGFAQVDLEKAHPGATAMFMILCGADQNPSPRGKIELAEQHGRSLAEAVDHVLAGEMRRIQPPIRTAYQEVTLDFAPRDRQYFETEAQDKDIFKQRRARLMLQAIDSGHPVRSLTYPVQALRLDDGLTMVALGGEVVVDYDLRLKREFPQANLVVAGYCNEVACYIPSQRVLHEGGYEPVDSMIYYGQPGPLADDVEDRIMKTVRQVLKKVGVKAKQ
jgi:neutral ceramidase